MTSIDTEEAATFDPLILVAADDLPRFHELVPPGIPVYGVVDVAEDAVTLVDGEGRGSQITAAPMLCLGLLATRKASLPLLDRARERFERWSAHDFPAPVAVPTAKLAERVTLLLSTTLVERLQSYAAHTTRLSRELARLRVAHEYLHNSFAAVEAFLGASNVQPCLMAFENPPADGAVLDADHPGGVAQALPVSSVGLSAVQLHIGPDAGAGGAPGFLAELRTAEDREVHGSWRIGPEQLQPGWLTLSLRKALVGLQRTPELVLRPQEDASGRLPPLSVGGMQPLPGFRPRLPEGGAAGLRSLALRVWVGLPGVQPPNLGRLADLQPRREGALIHEVAFPFEMLEAVEHLPGEWRPEFSPVHTLPELRGLVCHPPPSGLTLGRLPDLEADEASRFAVRVAVRSPDSAPVEFALAFADLPEVEVIAALARDGAGDGAQAGPRLARSAWRRVAPTEPELLALDVPPLASGRGSLYFATRMAAGAPNAFAWATFFDLRRTMLGRTDGDPALPPQPPASRSTPAPQAPYPASVPEARLHSGAEGIELPPALLETLAEVAAEADGWESGQPAVTYDHDRRGILCHPPPSGDITLGRLPDFVERSPFRLQARLFLANDKAAPVEFAMVISDLPAEAVRELLRHDLPAPAGAHYAFSGWQLAGYEEDVWLEVEQPEAGLRRLDLYFATRMAFAGDANDYAWAFFADPRIATPAEAGP